MPKPVSQTWPVVGIDEHIGWPEVFVDEAAFVQLTKGSRQCDRKLEELFPVPAAARSCDRVARHPDPQAAAPSDRDREQFSSGRRAHALSRSSFSSYSRTRRLMLAAGGSPDVRRTRTRCGRPRHLQHGRFCKRLARRPPTAPGDGFLFPRRAPPDIKSLELRGWLPSRCDMCLTERTQNFMTLQGSFYISSWGAVLPHVNA